MSKFRKGQRVVPKSYKTGDFGATLEASTAWNKAKQKGQPYLWVHRVCGDFHIECGEEKGERTGCDFFYAADLEPFNKR